MVGRHFLCAIYNVETEMEIIGRTFTAKQNKIPSLPVIPPEVNGV